MKIHLNRLPAALLCACLFFAGEKIVAQAPHTDFSATPLSGCAPLVVKFTDLSTGTPTTWRWDLGNGTISTLQHPTATYFNPGSYSVKLVVRNAAGADSLVRLQYITVFPKPVAAFAASDTSGCFPHAVQFTDQSTATPGTITSWLWDFGDGNTSALPNPQHIYNSAGNYTVSLRVVNNNGCAAIVTKPAHITITNGVKASFTNTTAATCGSNPSITFTSTSTGPGVLNYEWHFGDGGVSALANPVHTYTTPGSYTVSLIVSSPQGCRDTITKVNLITFGTIQSQFTSPATVCAGAVMTVVNTTTPTPGSSTWYFGDGTTSTGLQATKIYTVPGTYTIKLVNDFGACKDSVTKQVVVNAKPDAGFTADQVVSCRAPFTVLFTAAQGGNTYSWTFGDGGTATTQTPSHTYTSPGVYSVRLIVKNNNGCADTLTRTNYITIKLPVITVAGLPRTGCLPLTITPSATVTSSEPIVTWLWDFGNGATSTSATPTYTYTLPGTYAVSVTVTTASGCTQTFTIPNAVKTGQKPSAKFTVNPNDVCAWQAVNFTDASTGIIDQWLWDFGDGATSILQNPSHVYGDTGYFNVTLIVRSNTCPDTIRYNNIVHIRPPVARFNFTNNCTQKYTRQFIDNSIGALNWAWNFGDGNTSRDKDPAHTYAAPGTYTVTLTVTNGVCSYTTTKTVSIIDEKAVFSADQPVICRNGTVKFTATGINATNIQQWQWNFGDGTPSANTATSVNHTYKNAGIFRVVLIIKDALGCIDSSFQNITVYGPTANFAVVNPTVCLGNAAVTFTDQSVTDGQHPLNKWVWNYGDGITETYSAAPFQHIYTTRGTYPVRLTVTDEFGCADSITKNNAVIISKPVADFYSPDTLSCTNKPISFVNTSVGNTMTWDWHFGDGTTSSQLNPLHTYAATGLYSVQLNVRDQYGCTDTIVKNDYINISLPVAAFLMSDSVSSCPPLKVSFTSQAQNTNSVRWDFGDGNTSILTNPEHNYTLAGIFYAKQFVTGPGGCTDTLTKRIEVKGPSGTFSYSPLVGCNPLTVTFNAVTQNQVSILWDFTDGATTSTTGNTVTHAFATPGDYIPRMILTDAGGCNVPVLGKDTVHVIGVHADFTMSNTSICDAGIVSFQNNTVSNDYISSWKWSFGDGTTSTAQHPQHSFTTPGAYTVSLLATSAQGCADSLVLTDTINIYARPLINITGAASSCIPASVQFAGGITRGSAADISWSWNMGNGVTDTLRIPAAQPYTKAGTYAISAIATDKHNCRDTAFKTFIAHPLPVVDAGADALVCLGTPIRLAASGAASYVWQQGSSLSCTDCSSPFANPSDNITYVVTGATAFGCKAIDSVSVRVRKPFELVHSPNDTLCMGENAKLFASGADQYQWSPAATLNNSAIANPIASPVNTTTYQVIASDSDNCFSKTGTIVVKVYPIPTVDAGPDQTLAVGSSVKLKPVVSADVTKYAWTPAYNISCAGCKDPTVSPRRNTDYQLEVKNDGGCSAKDAFTITVVCNNGNLFVPNTFTPNGDGMNDYFYPRGKGLAMIKSLRVYNRWGEVVFERMNFSANDAAAGWDGSYKGKKLSADVFIYTCDVVCENNEVLSYKGDVTLLR